MTLLALLMFACGPLDDFEGDDPLECEDVKDNDGDGRFDCSDPGCADAPICTRVFDTAPTTESDTPVLDPTLPTADAGPDRVDVMVGEVLKLVGSGSPGDGASAIASYTWTLRAKPAQSSTDLERVQNTQAHLYVDAPGKYRVQLDVFDGENTASDEVAFLVQGSNTVPWAVITNDEITAPVGQNVTLDGTASFDANGDPLAYAWSIVTLPPTSIAVALSSTHESTTSWVPDVQGDYYLQLVVRDGTHTSRPTLARVRAFSPAVTGP